MEKSRNDSQKICFFLKRYATTLVTSGVRNPEPEAREIFLTVILPDTAFISRFAIEVEGQLFVAFVKEKEDAWREYQEAVQTGKTAGEHRTKNECTSHSFCKGHLMIKTGLRVCECLGRGTKASRRP